MGSIQVSHVGWRRPGGAELLRDVNFTVGNGDRVALVGANGVGKSTLMRLIAGEATATTGTISIDGRLGVMRQLVGDIVRGGMDRRRAAEHVLGFVAANVDEADRGQFRQIAEEELLALHEGNFARYQVRPSEFSAWQQAWDAKP